MSHDDSHWFVVLDTKLDALLCLHRVLLTKVDKIMATIDQVAQDVTDESTLIDGVSTLVSGLQQQLKDALSGASLPPTVQAKVDAVFATAEANKAKLSAALAAGTTIPPSSAAEPPVGTPPVPTVAPVPVTPPIATTTP